MRCGMRCSTRYRIRCGMRCEIGQDSGKDSRALKRHELALPSTNIPALLYIAAADSNRLFFGIEILQEW